VKVALLGELLREYTAGEAFLSYFPEVLTGACADPTKYGELFSNVLMGTKLAMASQVTMALALYLHDQKEVAEVGEAELERKLKELRALNKRGGELPDRVLDEILFQVSQNSALQERLQEEYEYLLATSAEKGDRVPAVRLHNYLNNEWQFFANDPSSAEKAPPLAIRKCDLLRDLGPAGTSSPETLKLVLGELGPITEEEALECLLMMAEERSNVDSGVEKFVTDLLVASKKNLKGE
jgi:hypothetical protein